MLLFQVVWNEVEVAVNWKIFNRLIAVAEIGVDVYFWFRVRLCAYFYKFCQFCLTIDSVQLDAGFVDLVFSFEEYFEAVILEWLLLQSLDDDCIIEDGAVCSFDWSDGLHKLIIIADLLHLNLWILFDIFNQT